LQRPSLFVFNQYGDCLAATLRPGNVHSADGSDEVLLPVIDRHRAEGRTVVVRADAAFALPAVYEPLEGREVRYAIRLPANDVLVRQIEDLLTRPRGRPSHAPLVHYRSSQYQAASWDRPRRVIAKVEHHLGELFPRVGSSSPLRPGRTGPWSASTISAGRWSSGSRQARKTRTGLGSPATASGPTRRGCFGGSSRTVSGILAPTRPPPGHPGLVADHPPAATLQRICPKRREVKELSAGCRMKYRACRIRRPPVLTSMAHRHRWPPRALVG